MKSKFFKNGQRRLAAVLVIVLGVAFVVRAAEKQFSLPPETATLKPGPGSEMMAQCRMCHSVDYISTQPRFTRTVWTAEVTKMITKYGAPISTNLVPQLVDYLTANYGQENPK